MVKVKKRKKRGKPSRSMFFAGGLKVLLLGAFIAVIYQTLVLFISVETQIEEIALPLFKTLFYQLGLLMLLCGFIFFCYSFLNDDGFLKKYGGSFMVSGALLALAASLYSQYDSVVALKEQTISMRSFFTLHFPTVMLNFSKVYFFVGTALLGMYLWGSRRKKKWSAGFFMGSAITICITLVLAIYNSYDMYKMYLATYGADKDVVITQFLFPDILNNVSKLLVVVGVLLFSASFVLKRNSLRKWTGRTWFFAGAAGVFHWFLSLGMSSRMIRNEMTGVRQSIMQLTPYSTTFKEYPLVIETLKEFYAKKMIPTYLEHSFLIAIFAGIGLIAIYLWVRE